MRNKFRGVLLAMISVLLVALVCIFVRTGRTPTELLLIAPANGDVSGVDYKKIEEINGTKFILTYETIQNRFVKALNISHNIIFKETNHTYPFIMNYSMVDGGFFTDYDMKQKNKRVVLNEAAAFGIFGATNISGNEICIGDTFYKVVGVIKDQDDENKNIYAPISSSENSPDIFMVKMDSSGKDGTANTVESIQNEFKRFSITPSNYDFINIEALRRITREKTVAAIGLIVFIALLHTILLAFRTLLAKFKDIKELSKVHYFASLLRQKPVIRFLWSGLFTLAIVSAFGWVSIWFLEIFLRWNANSGTLGGYNSSCFNMEIQILRSSILYSDIFFYGFTIVVILFFVADIGKTRKIIQSQHPLVK